MESDLKAADGSNEEEWRTCVCLAWAFTRGGSNKLLLGSQVPALALRGQHFPFPRRPVHHYLYIGQLGPVQDVEEECVAHRLTLSLQVPASPTVSFLSNFCDVVLSIENMWDFPGGPVVKNPPCNNAGGASSIPGWGTKIPHSSERLSLRVTTRESVWQ